MCSVSGSAPWTRSLTLDSRKTYGGAEGVKHSRLLLFPKSLPHTLGRRERVGWILFLNQWSGENTSSFRVCVTVWMHVCRCMRMCGGQWLTSAVLFCHLPFPPHFLTQQILLLAPQLGCLASEPQGSYRLPLSSVGITGLPHTWLCTWVVEFELKMPCDKDFTYWFNAPTPCSIRVLH